MSQSMQQLDAHRADPFEVYHGVQRDKARWQWIAVGLLVCNVVLVAALTLSSLRPPQVIVKDRIAGQPPMVSSMTPEPEISVADARVFFLNMLKLRFAWDSLTVDRDMQAYLGQCFRDQRVLETRHLEEVIEVDDARGTHKLPRMQAWITAGIKNTLVLPPSIDDISCQKPEAGVWHCYMESSIATQRLLPPFQETAAPKARMAFLATLLEVRHTIGTPSGLIVGALREVAAETRQAATP